jgi:Protein of unknown function (DUF2934)
VTHVTVIGEPHHKNAGASNSTIQLEHANDPSGKEQAYIVARTVRLGTRLADDENCDPFLVVLRETGTDKEPILPSFRVHGQNNAQRRGQFPPLLSFEEWRTLFRPLDASFNALKEKIRVRAYELYEQRGKQGGRALRRLVAGRGRAN